MTGIVVVNLVGLIPVNNSFSNAESGVRVFVYSDNFHSEFFLPVVNDQMDWSKTFGDGFFQADIEPYKYLAIGWGDRKFFVETPTWDDFNTATALRAFFWPTDTTLHVTYQRTPLEGEFVRQVILTEDQYQALVSYIDQFIERDSDGNPIQLPNTGYTQKDTFFKSNGSYHIFWTCNAWVNQGMKQVGIRAPLYTPLPRVPLFYLPRSTR